MKKFQSMLALAAVAILAVACDDSTKTTVTPAVDATTDTKLAGDATATTDTAGDTAAPLDTTVTTDTVAPADAATTTAGAGCTSDGDKTFLGGLSKDKAAADKFTDDTKGCLLGGGAGKPDQKTASEFIGKCLVVDKKYAITETCGTCYGIRAYCAFKNCVANAAEAPTANCLAAASGEPCIACQTKYKCVEAAEACIAGK